MKNLGLPETISWQMKFVFKCFKPSHFLLSPIVRVPLFLGGGELSWQLKEALCVIWRKKSESLI